MFTMVEGPIVSPPSVAPTEDVAIVTDTVEGVFLVQNESIVVQGWVAAASATPTLRLVANTPQQFESSIKLTPAPNVLMAHPTLQSEHFEMSSECPVAVCDLVLDFGWKDYARVFLVGLLR